MRTTLHLSQKRADALRQMLLGVIVECLLGYLVTFYMGLFALMLLLLGYGIVNILWLIKQNKYFTIDYVWHYWNVLNQRKHEIEKKPKPLPDRLDQEYQDLIKAIENFNQDNDILYQERVTSLWGYLIAKLHTIWDVEFFL